MDKVATALTIAGTDPTGGAGIQADLKAFQELQSYGMSVITSVVAQNTTGVQSVHHVPLQMLRNQLEAVFSDMPVGAIKTGMIANVEMMEVIEAAVRGKDAPLVIDPVMVATSGDALIDDEARLFLREKLLPLAEVITPNLPEAEYLLGIEIADQDTMREAAKMMVHDYGAGAALIKGGHLGSREDAVDYLYDGKEMHTFSAKRVDTKNTHGTGCTYSAAIAAYRSHGYPLHAAVRLAKDYVTAAIRAAFDLGAGSGPTNHWAIREK